MKLQTIVSAVLFAAVSSLPFGALAADMEHMDHSHMDKAMEKAPAKKMKMMKPHSHLEEKVTGTAAPKAVEAAADSASAPAEAKDEHAKKGKNANHSHPRDAK